MTSKSVTKLPPLKVVYATSWFGMEKFDQDMNFNNRQCPIPEGYEFELNKDDETWCTLTSSKEDMENAAALMFHAPDTMLNKLPNHIKNQPWILESLETPYSSPFRADEIMMKNNFNYLASYHFRSSFLFSYFSTGIMDIANRPLPKNFIKTKTKSAPILWIAKNCMATNGREKYIKKLMEYIDVHSYGHCLHNKPFPENKSRMDLLGEYKFYLAVENSNCESYATEKLYDTFMMSAVPIVDGPPSYDGYIPSERSVIYMDAYPDPKDLADYIRYLDNNDTAYLEYFSYRQHALDVAPKDRLEPSFISNWSDPSFHNERSSYCSVCRGILPWWNFKANNYVDSYQEEDKESIFLVDQTCSPPGKWNYIQDDPPYTPDWTPRLPDEFTRPDIYVNASLDNNDNNSNNTIVHDDSYMNNPALIANFLFILFYVALITFLIRKSRKDTIHREAYTLTETV